ncbi:MAG: RodZ domain-containing protein [Usitatibacter sp.]
MESVDESADKAASRSLGQTLAAERERQGLSRSDAAQRLHMSAWQIEALETGDYQRLPKGTFLRGFVRNYAKVLGVSPEGVLGLLPEGAPRDKKPGIVVPTQNIRFDPIGDRLQNPYVKASALAFVALALGFAAMYWVFYVRPAQTGVGAAPKATEKPVPAITTPPSADAVTQAPTPPAPEPAKVEAPKRGALRLEPPKAEVLKAGADGKVLKFRFKGTSWVEIRDARGQVLLARLNPAGSEAEVAGRPPFNVIVGNAPEVQLFYNDHEFDLEPHTKVAVARFTVE